jgi:hypothetical protein
MLSKLNKEVMNIMKSAVEMCASKYNFDGEEAYRMICSSEGIEVKSRRRINEKKEKKLKSMFPLPYNGELNGECCMGIRQNSGLYTQCPTIRPEGAAYCGSCNKQAAKNEHGLPDYGNIQKRLSKYNNDEEFVDPSGKKPVAYTRVMKKYKVSKEEVLEEAEKHGLKIDPRHFVEVEKKSGRPAKEPKETKEAKAKGRPKKSKKVLELAGEEEDLFASLVMSANSNSKSNEVEVEVEVETIEVDEDDNSSLDNSSLDNSSLDNSSLGEVDVVVDAKKSKKLKAKEDEKAAKKKAIEDEKAAKKKAIEDEKAAKKQAIEDEKAAKLKEKEEKAALVEQKKKEKEEKAALAEQKKKEKEEKAALAEQKKKEKEAKVALSEEKKVKKTKSDDDDDDRLSPAFVDPPADVVKKIDFEGKKYLKSKNTGIIYNMDQDVIGKWNEEKQRIDFTEVDEESEDEYEEDE